jgi:hypothetical protein
VFQKEREEKNEFWRRGGGREGEGEGHAVDIS